MRLRASKIKRHAQFYVYMIRCANGTLYTGSTSNLKKRFNLHKTGRGAKYLRGKGPLTLVFSKEYQYYKNVLKAERILKRRAKKYKEKLIKLYAKARR
jgi:putative endonuclease